MTEQVRIGTLPLPAELVEAIDAGRWRPPADEALLAEVFRDRPDGPQFYDVPTMRRQNRFFQTMPPERVPGLDPAHAVIIGDLGADMPIVLDYRPDPAVPRVRYLRADEWLDIAPDLPALLRTLGLDR